MPLSRASIAHPIISRRKVGAIVMMQLENGVHLPLGVANVRLEETGQPLQDYNRFL